MIVISDTTAIHYLVLIGKESILTSLFDQIIIPDAVVSELSHPNAPEMVRRWIEKMPEWAVVKSASGVYLQTVEGLGIGEASAIAIAMEINSDFILLDDRQAVREAERRGLKILSTFAVLEVAAIRGLIDFEEAIADLSETNFRFPPSHIMEDYLSRNQRRNST